LFGGTAVATAIGNVAINIGVDAVVKTQIQKEKYTWQDAAITGTFSLTGAIGGGLASNIVKQTVTSPAGRWVANLGAQTVVEIANNSLQRYTRGESTTLNDVMWDIPGGVYSTLAMDLEIDTITKINIKEHVSESVSSMFQAGSTTRKTQIDRGKWHKDLGDDIILFE